MVEEKLEEAPYTFIWEECIVDGKKVKVFKLGKFGREKLEKAITRESIQELELKVRGLELLLDKNVVVAIIKQRILDEMPKTKAVRHYSIKNISPYLLAIKSAAWLLFDQAVRELVSEGKLVEKKGWIRLVLEKVV